MRVAMICNTAWLDEELTTLQHLVTGLAADGVELVHVAPEPLAAEQAFAVGERVTWCDSSWSALRGLRLGQLAPQLRELNVEVIHALDGRVWLGALKLGRALGVPVVLGAVSRLDLSLTEKVRVRAGEDRATFTATTAPLGEALRKALGRDVSVEVIPPGVAVGEQPPAAAKPAESVWCAAICSSGLFDPDCQALFESLPAILADYPQAQFFLDGQGRDQHPLWQAARRYDLLANISMVPRRLGRRELLLMADLIIQPQPLGRSRGLTLQAMARGVPILACGDPWLDYLIDGQTAWLVDRSVPARLEQLIRRAVTEPNEARQLGARARQWVRTHHSVAAHVMRTLGLYRQVTGQAIRFHGAEAN